jgi:thiamine biosynthesis lipoprotein
LVEAGGDCYLAGESPDGGLWRVAVEDPFGGVTPIAVLSASDCAIATSSIRVRRWRIDSRLVHHLIDPRTGHSGGSHLVAVTVVGADPADAEVESKVLFLAGRDRIAAVAESRDIAALWCDTDGNVVINTAMRRNVLWERS